MRIRHVVTLTALLGLAACTPGSQTEQTTTDGPGLTGSTTTAAATPSTPSTVANAPTSTVSSAILGLVTPAGVPVAVLEELSAGFLVMTPCGFEVELQSGKPLGRTRVVIDPGHGGPTDTGAVGANGLAEKEINLEVARLVVDLLAERGIDAVLTRNGDYTSPLFVRAHLADTLQADLMVSIHHNAPTPGPSDEPGIEIFIQKDSKQSARLGGLLWGQTREALATFDVAWSAAEDSGVMTVLNNRGDDAYGILRHPETTTALVELGYISNPPEADLFSTPEYPPVAAAAVADAVKAFLTTEDPGSGFVEGRVFNPRPGVSQDVCSDPELGTNADRLFPDVVDVVVQKEGDGRYSFDVTLSSPYDSPEQYADAWRIRSSDGTVFGVRELLHDHAGEQPFTRSLRGVEIPTEVDTIVVEGRDLANGWGGGTMSVDLP